jgi:cytoskeletal protein CcmA (bactofilin family)
MTSQINVTNINSTYPIPGRDNDSQGFRTNFGAIKIALAQAATEINELYANKADLVEPSFLSNTTPSFSTNTGALTVAGGVGIAGDLYVGGNVISNGTVGINSGTTAPILQSGDVVFSGTYGTPTLTLKSTLYGNRNYAGTLSIGASNPTPNLPGMKLVYVSSTATNQVGAYIYGGNNVFTNLTLDTFRTFGDGGSSNYIKFVKSPNNTTSTISTFRLDTAGTGMEITGNVSFTGNVTVSGAFTNTSVASYPPTNNSSIGSFVLACDSTGTVYTPGTSTSNTLYRVGRFVPGGAPTVQYTLNPSTTLTLGGSTILPYYEGMPIRFDDVPTSGTWLSLALIHTCWYYTADRTTFTATSVGNPVYLWVRIA